MIENIVEGVLLVIVVLGGLLIFTRCYNLDEDRKLEKQKIQLEQMKLEKGE
jgi:hypothetical protein